MKLPKKYRKMGLKKGWPAYKKAQKAAAAKRKRTLGKSAAPKKKSPTKKAKKKTSVAKPKRSSKRMTSSKPLFSKKPLGLVVDLGLLALATTGSTALMNKTPYVQRLNVWFKLIGQGALGYYLFSQRKEHFAKIAGLGFMGGAILTGVLPRIPILNNLLSGGRSFSSQEVASLQNTMGKFYVPPGARKPAMNGFINTRTPAMAKPYGRKSSMGTRARQGRF